MGYRDFLTIGDPSFSLLRPWIWPTIGKVVLFKNNENKERL
jgi:hypothetical protein